jgi:hypothetical protein
MCARFVCLVNSGTVACSVTRASSGCFMCTLSFGKSASQRAKSRTVTSLSSITNTLLILMVECCTVVVHRHSDTGFDVGMLGHVADSLERLRAGTVGAFRHAVE